MKKFDLILRMVRGVVAGSWFSLEGGEKGSAGEPAEVELAQCSVPVAASTAASTGSSGQLGRADEVVRGAAGDHTQRDVDPPGQRGDLGDRPVAAGDDEPLGVLGRP